MVTYTCDFCGKRIEARDNVYAVHMRRPNVSAIANEWHLCPECGRKVHGHMAEQSMTPPVYTEFVRTEGLPWYVAQLAMPRSQS